jgi:broad specificity phosphatase PhoE
VTTTLFLVRHAPHELQGKVQVGRRDGVALAQASYPLIEALGRRLASERLDAVFASPIDRARETAAAIAAAAGLQVTTDEDLSEMDMGRWTGESFETLESEPTFRAWNACKSLSGAPGGERSTTVQDRMARAVGRVRTVLPQGRAALVSHGDPLKCLVCACLGLPLDSMHRFDLDPASVSTVVVGDWGAKVLRLNERVTI